MDKVRNTRNRSAIREYPSLLTPIIDSLIDALPRRYSHVKHAAATRAPVRTYNNRPIDNHRNTVIAVETAKPRMARFLSKLLVGILSFFIDAINYALPTSNHLLIIKLRRDSGVRFSCDLLKIWRFENIRYVICDARR